MVTGKLRNEKIFIDDEKEANQIYNKGYFGKPLSGGGLELNELESLYLLESGRIEEIMKDGEKIGKESILKITQDDFSTVYSVYEDMRMRGYVVKEASEPAELRVFPRGGGPGQTPTKFWTPVYQENDTFSAKDILETTKYISNLKKETLCGLVDEEDDVTYYSLSTIDLKGKTEEYRESKLKGTLYDYKTIIIDREIGEGLHNCGFYGSLEEDELKLSPIEALYLMENSKLELQRPNGAGTIDVEKFKDNIRKEKNFELHYSLYKDLRSKGIIPKTGFKYGAKFRAYAGDPEEHHAEYIIQPVEKDFTCSWFEVSRAVRVAHTVKKDLLYAVKEENGFKYLKIERSTP